MTRDYSQFLPTSGTPTPKRQLSALERLGWQPFFAQQTDLETLVATPPVRAVEQHRSGLRVMGDGIDTTLPPGPEATVGDWLLLNRDLPANSAVLNRKSLFQRRAPGTDRRIQLIAANVDTAFIVSSCNADFNIARLERFVAVAFQADVTPVVLLTKADLCDDPSEFASQARTISDRVPVLTLNARSGEPATALTDWCKPGQTVAFLGSSGVGKSTLVNALFGTGIAATAGIREDDAKGRHTTRHRHLHFTADGCGVLDTPGIRELQLTEADEGVADVFEDITELATQCRFNDCKHDTEPGCSVRAALETGAIDENRLARWRKLVAEERFNTASIAERRADDKAFGKMVRSVMKHKKR
ncbi:ribosome small subunit-dependent GTPase A [Shimia abyssi]|uniref:Small ribosomal subunit biogenesis GTPase RsgA n=1 Tax=Shimia abyssi TaxID=1662395 RepID=A0A2P8FHT3_9RHOB|nr:ribosome small subunit-dependent GTPase A [Shimia abyssi]PSL21230.1 ribosome biogenesis GTPase [Shimia abyssi]